MNKLWLGIIGLVMLVLAAVIVVKAFSPDKPETKSRADSAVRQKRRRTEVVRSGFADNTTQEELFKVALSQNQAGCSSEMDYMVVIACCREILKKEPDSPYTSKVKELLQQMPKSYVKRYDRELSSTRHSGPKVKKSKRLRRGTPRRYRERFELDRAITERLAKADKR